MRARSTSPVVTAFVHRVPDADIVQRSPFIIAPAVHDPHVVGYAFPDAFQFPRSSRSQTTRLSAYAFAVFRTVVSASACAVDTGLFASEVLSTFPSPISDFVPVLKVATPHEVVIFSSPVESAHKST